MFQFADEQQLFFRARACFVERTRAGKWVHLGPRKIGNFVQEDWCRSNDRFEICEGNDFGTRAGDEWYHLSTTFYEKSWPNVSGVRVEASRMPMSAKWGVNFYYSSAAMGHDMTVTFVPLNAHPNAKEIMLGSYVYSCAENESEKCGVSLGLVEMGGGMERELELLIASPDSLRATALARFDALWLEVSRFLADGRAEKAICKPTKLPDCESVPFSAAELEAAHARATADFAAYRETIQLWAPEFHRILTELMQFERCWD